MKSLKFWLYWLYCALAYGAFKLLALFLGT